MPAAMNIFKRSDEQAAPYYTRFMVRGKVSVWCTKTNIITLARKRAKDYRDAIISEQFHVVEAMKSRSSGCTFADVFKQYLDMPLTIDPTTKKKNVAGMAMVLTASGLAESDRIDRLSSGVAVKFQRESLEQKVPPSTINSRMRSAKSLFSRRAMLCYAPKLPAQYVDDFKSVPSLNEPEKLPEIPRDDALALVHKQLPAYPDVYRCFLLATYAGMRAGEIAAARWDWLDGDVIYIGGKEFHAKSRKWRPVRIDPVVLAMLHAAGDKHETFIAGPYPVRTATKKMAPMLRALGYNFRNPSHAARRWAGSVVADAQGIYAAQNLLGHSTPAVTAKSYARMTNLPLAIPLTITTPFVPHPPAT